MNLSPPLPPLNLPLRHGKNFGALKRTVTGGDLVINTADHTPGMVVPYHEHSNAYVCVVVAGEFELAARGAHACPAGSVIAHPAGHGHANRFSDRFGRCLSIHFGASWDDDRALNAWLADFRHARVAPARHSLQRLVREVDATDSAAPLAAAGAAIELLAEAMRAGAPPPAPRWVSRIVEVLEADLGNTPSLAALAREVGLHPAHVTRIFRQARGESIGEYVRRRRCETADQALRGDLPLADIAAAAGFSDQAHFTRVFRRQFGMAPGMRRRMLRSF